jgi:hypothetical protein
MTTTTEFTITPGATARPGAPANPLTNIRHVVPPAGEFKAHLDRFTGAYSAPQQSRLVQSLLDLRTAGILDAMDLLCIRGLTLQDSLINWATTDLTPTLAGGVFTPGAGIVLDGVDDYISGNFGLGSRFTVGSAVAFGTATALAPGYLANPRIVGRLTSEGNSSLEINIGSTGNATGRVNRTLGVSGPSAGEAPRLGTWAVTDQAGVNVLYRDGAVVASGEPGTVEAHSVAEGICWGRWGGTYWPWTYSAFGYGAGLNTSQVAVLTATIAALNRVI